MYTPFVSAQESIPWAALSYKGEGFPPLFLVKANKLVFCLNKIFEQSQLVHLMNYWHMLPVYMLLLEIVLVLKQILEFAVVPMRK